MGNFPTDGVGLGLRREFAEEVAEKIPDEIVFFEIAPENYIGRGGVLLDCLERIATKRPIIAHGLTLSIGGTDELNWAYLKKLKTFLRDWKIPWFSDHLCFSSRNAHELHDLLPLPFTREAVLHVSERARIAQDFLEVPFALENVSFYYHPAPPEMSELDFIREILERSGVNLMLDVNNVYVNSVNHGTDAAAFLAGLPCEKILQIHIAGHFREAKNFIIDTHGEAVSPDVWTLLAGLGERMKLPPILIERDGNFPGVNEILAEVRQAKRIYDKSQILDPDCRGRSRTTLLQRPFAGGSRTAPTILSHVQNFFLKLCTDVTFDASTENLRRVTPDALARHLAQIPVERLTVYRRLTTANVKSLLKKTFPLFFRWTESEAGERLIRLFLHDGIRSNQYRYIPQEFLSFVNRDSEARALVSERLTQLAEFEFAEYDLIFHETSRQVIQSDPDAPLDKVGVLLNPALTLKRYDFPVHAVSDISGPEELPATENLILFYRDPSDFKIHRLLLASDSYMFLEVLLSSPQQSLSTHLEEMAKRLCQKEPPELMRECLDFLKTLIEKRIVLALVRNDR